MQSYEPTCPSCGSSSLSAFYQLSDVPVHDVVLMHSQREALSVARGTIRLFFCQACGFVSNLAFDAALASYSAGYEGTQSFSPTFSAFSRRLAAHLIERFDLRHKHVLEIGCGMGEFLALLCEMGPNRGTGFDPAYVDGRLASQALGRIEFIKDVFSERYSPVVADFVCCKMTLEHIHDVAGFVSMVRRSLSEQSETLVYFQVPDVQRILEEAAFWDIYYEHCSYFSPGSLGRLFHRCGFALVDRWTAYEDQYVLLVAKPCPEEQSQAPPQEVDLHRLTHAVDSFARRCPQQVLRWKRLLRQWQQRDQKVVVWGAGSKCVSFLHAVEAREEIAYTVDMNPFRQGTYVPGTGHRIVGPGSLSADCPHIVIVMNPAYVEEIGKALHQRGLGPRLVPLCGRAENPCSAHLSGCEP